MIFYKNKVYLLLLILLVLATFPNYSQQQDELKFLKMHVYEYNLKVSPHGYRIGWYVFKLVPETYFKYAYFLLRLLITIPSFALLLFLFRHDEEKVLWISIILLFLLMPVGHNFFGFYDALVLLITELVILFSSWKPIWTSLLIFIKESFLFPILTFGSPISFIIGLLFYLIPRFIFRFQRLFAEGFLLRIFGFPIFDLNKNNFMIGLPSILLLYLLIKMVFSPSKKFWVLFALYTIAVLTYGVPSEIRLFIFILPFLSMESQGIKHKRWIKRNKHKIAHKLVHVGK